MWKFHASFAAFGQGDFTPAAWERYFLRYDPAEWEREGDGVFTYFSDDGLRYDLIVTHDLRTRGFVIAHTCWSTADKRSIHYRLAVSDPHQLDAFTDSGDDLIFPVGCVFTPLAAWPAVRDFLLDPVRPSPALTWVEDSELAWPEP